jgi:glucokinase
MTWLGIDIGGTNTKVALLDDAASVILEHDSTPTDRADAHAAVRHAAELGAHWANRHPDIRGVGVTIPGHFDAATGRATIVPNIPGRWLGLPVREEIAASVSRPTTLINDARAFGLAESRLGAARDSANVVALVLGTGVGGAVILGGRLYNGQGGLAGEIGHMVLKADGPSCRCGNRGCLESLTRADVVAESAGTDTVAEAVVRARAGDGRALAAIDAAARWIGIGLAGVATLLTPDAIVIGGGIAQAGEVLFAPLRKELLERTPLLAPESFRVLPAALGTIAGAVGAATIAHDAPAAPRSRSSI